MQLLLCLDTFVEIKSACVSITVCTWVRELYINLGPGTDMCSYMYVSVCRHSIHSSTTSRSQPTHTLTSRIVGYIILEWMREWWFFQANSSEVSGEIKAILISNYENISVSFKEPLVAGCRRYGSKSLCAVKDSFDIRDYLAGACLMTTDTDARHTSTRKTGRFLIADIPPLNIAAPTLLLVSNIPFCFKKINYLLSVPIHLSDCLRLAMFLNTTNLLQQNLPQQQSISLKWPKCCATTLINEQVTASDYYQCNNKAYKFPNNFADSNT